MAYKRSLLPRRLVRLIYLINPQRLWVRYAVGFGLIVGLLIVADFISQTTIRQMQRDAGTINVMGKQRMLSQRILFLILEHGDQPAEALDPALPQALDDLASNHTWILANAIQTPALEAMYFDRKGGNLDARTQALISATRAVVNSYPEDRAPLRDLLIEQVRDDLLGAYDAAVTLFERAANDKVATLERVRSSALTVSLLILMIEAIFIFMPAHVAVRRGFLKHDKQVALLHRQNLAVEAQRVAVEKARAELSHAAHHDALTGLHNRRALLAYLEALLIHPPASVREPPQIGVIQIDLDNFKPINDRFGHAAGDRILEDVAAILRSETRQDDFVARLGGDEFVIVLSKYHAVADVQSLAKRVIAKLADLWACAESSRTLGASFGYATGLRGSDSADAVIHRADEALYEAKRSGRNRLELHTERDDLPRTGTSN